MQLLTHIVPITIACITACINGQSASPPPVSAATHGLLRTFQLQLTAFATATCHAATDFDLLSLETVLSIVLHDSAGQVTEEKGFKVGPLHYSDSEFTGFLVTVEESERVAAHFNYDSGRMSAAVAEFSRRMRQATVASQSQPWKGTDHLQLRYAKLGRVSGVPFVNLVHEDTVSAMLRERGDWESLQTELLQGFLRPGDVAVDVGAHIGTHAVAFSHVVGPSGTVYAFEAQPSVFEVLAENAKLGGVGNMIARNVGIGNTQVGGKVAVRVLDVSRNDHANLDEYSHNRNNFGGLSLLGCSATGDVNLTTAFDASSLQRKCSTTNSSRDSHVWVDVVSLDSFGWHVGASPKCPRVIKIDVEGMETQVLAGGRGLLSRCRPVLHVENNVPSGSQTLIKWLVDAGYELYWEVSAFGSPKNYFGGDFPSLMTLSQQGMRAPYSSNLLCLPPGFDLSGLSPITQSIIRSLTPVDPDKPLLSQYDFVSLLEEAFPTVESVNVSLHSEHYDHAMPKFAVWYRIPHFTFSVLHGKIRD